MSHRTILYGLLFVVAAAAAVLSFAALRDLALVCGFAAQLAWLLPVTVDAGAAAGSIVWLGRTVGHDATVFARALALTLLALSVAANALGHGLAAFSLAPAWWVVVIVSAIAPAVLGAVVHLAVLVGRQDPVGEHEQDDDPSQRKWTELHQHGPFPLFHEPDNQHDDERGTATTPAHRTPDETTAASEPVNSVHTPPRAWPAVQSRPATTPDERLEQLLADGAGRKRIARELGITEHEARTILDRRRQPVEILERRQSVDA